MDWFAYVQNVGLLFDRDNVIHGVMDDRRVVEEFRHHAQEVFAELDKQFIPGNTQLRITPDDFIPAYISALATREAGHLENHLQSFDSAGQVLGLFDPRVIEKTTADIWNGIAVASFSHQYDSLASAHEIMESLHNGRLLLLPRDHLKLFTPAVQNALPGAVVFLLKQKLVTKQVLGTYLRKGSEPIVTEENIREIRAACPVTRTWERECRAEQTHVREYHL